MADITPMTGVGQRGAADILSCVDEQVKNLSGGDSEKVKEICRNVVDVLSGDNVKVSRGAATGVDGNKDTSKTSGSTGVPVLDDPNDAQAKEADLSKLISYLQLDNEERQTQMAKNRIDMQKSNLDTEHKDRMKQINESIQKMKDAEKASKLSRIFGWIGAVLSVVAAVVLTVVTGGTAAAFAIAGAVLAVTALTMSETGLTEKLVEKLAKHMQEKYGWSKEKAQIFASLVVNLSIMALQLGCSIGSMVSGAMAAAKAAADAAKIGADVGNTVSHTAKTVQNVVTIANTTVSAGALGTNGVSTYLTHRSENAKADTMELEKFITMLQQRLEESQEELQQLLQQIEAGVGMIAELISSSTDTSDQIARNLGQMA